MRKVSPAIAMWTFIHTVVDELKIDFILLEAKFEGTTGSSRIIQLYKLLFIQIIQNNFFFLSSDRYNEWM